jgi:mono/diheme cytochrome c family protein
MRVSRGAVAALLVAGVLGVAAGCGGDDDSADQTTTEATTTEATTAEALTTEAPATTTAPATTSGGNAAAAAEAGEIFFAATCTGCHLENGTASGGTGPQLAGAGLDEATIRNQVINGGGAMPAGLATGQDLDNVVAYVLSIQ